MCLGPWSPELERQRKARMAGILAAVTSLLEGEPEPPGHWKQVGPRVTTGGVFDSGNRHFMRGGEGWTAEVQYRSDFVEWHWSVRSFDDAKHGRERIAACAKHETDVWKNLRPLVSRAEAFRQADAFIAEQGLA